AVNSPARQKLEKKIDKLTRKLRSFNLVPETDSRSADKGVEQSRTASISIYGTVYEGTKIRIGNLSTTLKSDISRARFIVSPDEDKIIHQPL
ncbi:MAG: hypothetical protein ABFS19_14125, partial [Thermodesulfobacteriota bacterium]